MKFEEYFIANSEGKSNCVIRTFCKIFNKSYDEVYKDLCDIQTSLNASSFNDIEVFEKYMSDHNINKVEINDDIQIKDLKIDDNTHVVLCSDKKDFYHMVPIINNTVYDKNDSSLNLYVLSLYK